MKTQGKGEGGRGKGKTVTILAFTTVVLGTSAELRAQQDDAAFFAAPESVGVVLRWTWPEGERPVGYHVERREVAGGTPGAWSRLTTQPVTRVRARAEARSRLGALYDRYESLLFPANPLDELSNPDTYRSLLLLSADLEPEVARVLGLRFDDRTAGADTGYQYRLIAVTRSGNAEWGTSGVVLAGAYQPARGPDSLDVRQEQGGMGMRWSTAGVFSGYRVFRRRGASAEWTQVNTAPVVVFHDDGGAGTESSARFYMDSTVRVGDTLTYAIAGIDPFGRTSVRSNGVRVVVRDVIPPAPPSQVTTAIRRDTVVVSWVPSPDPAAVSYRLWRSSRVDGTFEPVGPAMAGDRRSVADAGRATGRTWWYYVTASDAAGNESAPSFVALAEIPDVTPPSTPANLRGSAQAPSPGGSGLGGSGLGSGLRLDWTAPPDSGLRGYRVYRASLSTGEFGLLTDTPLPGSSFVDSVRVGADHPFYYRVTAVDSAFNESAPSAVVSVRPPDVTPPSRPQITLVAPDEGALVVTWTANPEPDVTWYRVRYRVRGREAWVDADSVGPAVRSDTIPGLPPGELFEVTMIAIDDAGNRSELARPVTGRPVKRQPPRPPDLRASYDRKLRVVKLEWGTPATDVARVVVIRHPERDTTWVEVGSPEPAARRFEDRPPGGAGRWEYALRVLDRFGNAAESRTRRVEVREENP